MTYDELVNKYSGGKGYAFLTSGQKEEIAAILKGANAKVLPGSTAPLPPISQTGNTPVSPVVSSSTSPSSFSGDTGLPSNPAPNTNLVTFAETLDKALSLAKQKRAELFKGSIMEGLQGTMAASDFNTLFRQFNDSSSDAESKLRKLVEKPNPTYKTEQIGSDLYQYELDPNGKIIGSPVKIISGEKNVEGGYKFTQSDIQKGAANAGMDVQTFNQLDPETKNIIIENPKNVSGDSISSLFNIIKMVETGEEDYESIKSEIKTAKMTEKTRNYFLNLLEGAYKVYESTKPKETSLWDKVKSFF